MCINAIRRIATVLLCASLVVPMDATLGAQSPAERAVRAIVDSFFTDVAAERWDAAATRLDLQRFEPFFRQALRNARSEMRMPEVTPEQLMAQDSTMPRAVAEWEVARMKSARANRPFGDYSYEFAGVTTQHELFALTVPDAAAHWLAARDHRTQMRESFRRQGCPLAPLLTVFSTPKRTVLGVVVPDDSTAYVILADDEFPNSPENLISNERVLPLRLVGGTWRIQPREDLLFPANVGISVDCPRAKR